MENWYKAGSRPEAYAIGVDDRITYNGKRSGYIQSIVEQIDGFGTLMQTFSAVVYRGKRLRYTAAVKSEAVSGWAGLWMRVDGVAGEKSYVLDNMHDRPVKGTTDWQTYEVVLDVPPSATTIAFGILVSGSGQVWLSDIRMEAVDDAVLVTASKVVTKYADQPKNLDFSA